MKSTVIPLPTDTQGRLYATDNPLFTEECGYASRKNGIKIPNTNDFPESAKKGVSFQPFPRDKRL